MEQMKTVNVAIVGGGPGCKAIMDMILAKRLSQLRMKLIGVACTNPNAVGYRYAKEQGIYTTRDYRDLYEIKGLNMIIELTGREEVANEISRTKPDSVVLMDHVAARLFWDVFQIEEERIADRKKAEDALRESEAEKKAILDASLDSIRLVDKDMRIRWVNQTTTVNFEVRPEDNAQYCVCPTWVGPGKKPIGIVTEFLSKTTLATRSVLSRSPGMSQHRRRPKRNSKEDTMPLRSLIACFSE
jgi:hypothetical protein